MSLRSRAKSPLEKKSLRQAISGYRARWKLVNETILELDRKVPIAERYRGFLQMVKMTKAMNWFTSTAEEDAEVARRWRRLREIHCGQKENSV